MSYNPAVALEFFKAAGTPTDVGCSTVIFAENEAESALLRRRSRIYLLLDGEVSLLAGLKVIATVRAGEIFGEMAAITHAPRSATAVAQTDCRVIALDDAELKTALERKPAFALMLMSMLIARLRESIARLTAAGTLGEGAGLHEAAAFDAERLAELVSGLANDPPIYAYLSRSVRKRSRSASDASSAWANFGLSATSARNTWRVMACSSQSVSATALARRGDWSTRAASPKAPPGPRRSTTRPLMETATRPRITAYMRIAFWPSVRIWRPCW